MTRIAATLVVMITLSGSAYAAGIKQCDELKAEIAYSKMNIALVKADNAVSITVRYDPSPGTKSRAGIVEAYVRALKERLPDIALSTAN